MKTTFRILPYFDEYWKTRRYKLQVRKWWGWKTLACYHSTRECKEDMCQYGKVYRI